jgi:hypothetical protein
VKKKILSTENNVLPNRDDNDHVLIITIDVDSRGTSGEDNLFLILQKSRGRFKKADPRFHLLIKFSGLLVGIQTSVSGKFRSNVANSISRLFGPPPRILRAMGTEQCLQVLRSTELPYVHTPPYSAERTHPDPSFCLQASTALVQRSPVRRFQRSPFKPQKAMSVRKSRRTNPLGERAPFAPDPPLPNIVREIEMENWKQREIFAFNRRLARGIPLLCESFGVRCAPRLVAHIFHVVAGLLARRIGEYLSGPENKEMLLCCFFELDLEYPFLTVVRAALNASI